MVKTGVMVGEAVRVRGCLGAPTEEADVEGQVRPFIRLLKRVGEGLIAREM